MSAPDGRILHASCVAMDGRGVLITGPGIGTGCSASSAVAPIEEPPLAQNVA